MITYAQNLAEWEDWQRPYRFGVLLIFPPAEIARQIDALRAEYDPLSHSICPAHISVSDPLIDEMTPQLYDEIRDIVAATRRFEIHFDKPAASPTHGGVYYPILPQEPIDNLKRALHGSSAFSGQAHERRGIPPHMTIAEFLSIEESLALCEAIQGTAPSGSFTCDRLYYVVPDADFRFQKANSFLLGEA